VSWPALSRRRHWLRIKFMSGVGRLACLTKCWDDWADEYRAAGSTQWFGVRVGFVSCGAVALACLVLANFAAASPRGKIEVADL